MSCRITITKMMITRMPMIVPISPLFTVPPFGCPDRRLGLSPEAVVRLPLKATLVYSVKQKLTM